MRPKTEEHDYQFKMRHARRFLEEGNKVEVTVFFRGREMDYLPLGQRILDRLLIDCKDGSTIEQASKLEGQTLTLILVPRNYPVSPVIPGDLSRLAKGARESLFSARRSCQSSRPNGELPSASVRQRQGNLSLNERSCAISSRISHVNANGICVSLASSLPPTRIAWNGSCHICKTGIEAPRHQERQ
jgi:hypothetical protein